ncbi:MAG: hypothetical protein JKX67_08585 [Colwellia sp.]|nr:hypothetical protein [Colwellia sp.]
MSVLKSSQQIHTQLEKQWLSYKYHKAYLTERFIEKPLEQGDIFPLIINLVKPTDKQWLHHYDEVKNWLTDINQLSNVSGFSVDKQQTNYANMGKQIIPVTVTIVNIEALARYLSKWQAWQKFIASINLITTTFEQLNTWLIGLSNTQVKEIDKYQAVWPKLLKVCQYFLKYPQPKCYIRQLTVTGVDTKFIEQHKSILKSLLDHLLEKEAINDTYEKLAEHGFERRFGLLYEQPQIRFRLLDPQLTYEFSGVSDITIPLEQFQQLDLMIDRVFITENKTNGLAFPVVNNAIVIFGLGYGIQMLKSVHWLSACQIYYWGDIDTHGLAILSQLRSYFPNTKSLLMDEITLLACKEFWGQEPEHKSHKAELLANLTEKEQILYKNLKQNKWQPCLRLEQELIPFELLKQVL